MASSLVRSSPEPAVRVRALAGETVLTVNSQNVSLSTQEYKWVPANCWGNLTNCGEMTYDGLASRPVGVEILVAASCYRNRGSEAPAAMSKSAPRLYFYFFDDIECRLAHIFYKSSPTWPT